MAPLLLKERVVPMKRLKIAIEPWLPLLTTLGILLTALATLALAFR